MRSRKKIEAEIEDYPKLDKIAIEILLDIRDGIRGTDKETSAPESTPSKKGGRKKKVN